MRLLYPTRWTVRANSLKSVIDNYEALMDTWDEALLVVHDSEMKARIGGIISQMQSFDFAFGTILGELILRHSDNLSRTIQEKATSASEAQQIAKLVITTMQQIRQDKQYDLFWEKLLKFTDIIDISPPHLPRRKRRPARLEDGSTSGHYPGSAKDFYRQQYFEALDNAINCLIHRFDQPGYKTYSNLEQLLIKASKQEDFEDEFQVVTDFYKNDFNKDVLRAQLITFGVDFNPKLQADQEVTIFDIKDHFTTLSSSHRNLLNEVMKLLQLILIMPATNSSSERSFSALRRVKTYLRGTMLQGRLNNLMVLHVHHHRTDLLNLKEVANEFVSDCEHRLRIFGRF